MRSWPPAAVCCGDPTASAPSATAPCDPPALRSATRSFTTAQVTAFALSGSMFALFLYITLYMQEIEHLSPLQAGLRYLPFTVGSFTL